MKYFDDDDDNENFLEKFGLLNQILYEQIGE